MIEESNDSGLMLRAIQAIAMPPQDVESLVNQYRSRFEKRAELDDEARLECGQAIVRRFSKLAASAGAATALAGVVPGIGTAVALLGGTATDLAVTLKWQVDMCACLIHLYGYDLGNPEAQHLVFALAFLGALENAGQGAAVKLGSKAGVKALRGLLKGPALVFVKELLKKVGITFTRKALEKAIPFGVGVVVGGSSNYLLTRFIGGRAIAHLELDRTVPRDAA